MLQRRVVKDFKVHGGLQSWRDCGSALWENRPPSYFHIYIPSVTKLALNPWAKGTDVAPKMTHTIPAKQQGLSSEKQEKAGAPLQHLTKPHRCSIAVAGQGTVLLPPSLACCSPALHQEGRTMSSFGPTWSSTAPPSSLVSNPKSFWTATFVLSQAGDRCWRLAALWLCPKQSPEDNILGTLRHQFKSQIPKMSSSSKAHLKEMGQYHNCHQHSFECPNPFPLSAVESFLPTFIFCEHSFGWVYRQKQFPGWSNLSK